MKRVTVKTWRRASWLAVVLLLLALGSWAEEAPPAEEEEESVFTLELGLVPEWEDNVNLGAGSEYGEQERSALNLPDLAANQRNGHENE